MKKQLCLLVLSAMIGSAQAAEPDTIGYNKFRVGGYGEITPAMAINNVNNTCLISNFPLISL